MKINLHRFARLDDEEKIPDMYLEAVKQDGWALRYVPEELKTTMPEALELCRAAI